MTELHGAGPQLHDWAFASDIPVLDTIPQVRTWRCRRCSLLSTNSGEHPDRPAAFAEFCFAEERKLQVSPEPLTAVDRRDNVTALAAIRGRSCEDRLRVWLALGGTEDDFPAEQPTLFWRADGESTWHLHGRPGYGVWRGLCGAETFGLVTVSAGVPVLENDAMVCPQCEATHIP